MCRTCTIYIWHIQQKTQDHSLAWRTLGYVNDLNYKGKHSTKAKMNDYHRIMDVILDSYKKCLHNQVSFNFCIQRKNKYDYEITNIIHYR